MSKTLDDLNHDDIGKVNAQHPLDWSSKQSRILTANGLAARYYSADRGFPYRTDELPHHHLRAGTSHAVFCQWANEVDAAAAAASSSSSSLEQKGVISAPSIGSGESGDKSGNGSVDDEVDLGQVGQLQGSNRFCVSSASISRACAHPQSPPHLLLVGAWTRPLFSGAWEHSTSSDEDVFNLQTSTLFVDVRIPRTMEAPTTASADGRGRRNDGDCAAFRRRLVRAGSVKDLSDDDIKLYARRHAFGGYARVGRDDRPRRGGRDDLRQEGGTQKRRSGPLDHGEDKERDGIEVPLEGGGKRDAVCVRHHVVDWNYLPSNPRNRPNKWWAEFSPFSSANVWKEYSYATDDFGQHYYMERWERLVGRSDNGASRAVVVAMRKCEEDCMKVGGRDGILVVIGDHFNYIYGRPNDLAFVGIESLYPSAKSVVDLIDLAVDAGDRSTAEYYLSIDAGHGTVSSGWVIDLSLRPWREGAALFGKAVPRVVRDDSAGGKGETRMSCHVLWEGERWDFLECSGMDNAEMLQTLFEGTSGARSASGLGSRL